MFRIAAALLLLASTHADAGKKPKPLKIVVALNDGSRLYGEPTFESVRVRTSKAEHDVSVRDLVAASRGKEGWTVCTGKGDEFRGNLLTPSLSMNSILGPVTVQMQHVVSLESLTTNLGISVPHREDLVLYMSFDASRGKRVRNLARPRHHATVRGAKWTPKGKRRGAYEFDGAATLVIPDHAELNPEAFTFAAWIYPQDGDGRWRLVMSKTNTGSWFGGYGFCRYSGDKGNLYFYSENYSSGSAKSSIPLNQWVHVAGVCDGKQVTIYINGEPSAPRKLPTTTAGAAASFPLLIGGGGSYNWKGKIDEVMLFKRALTALEIEQLMIAAEPGRGK